MHAEEEMVQLGVCTAFEDKVAHQYEEALAFVPVLGNVGIEQRKERVYDALYHLDIYGGIYSKVANKDMRHVSGHRYADALVVVEQHVPQSLRLLQILLKQVRPNWAAFEDVNELSNFTRIRSQLEEYLADEFGFAFGLASSKKSFHKAREVLTIALSKQMSL